MTISFRIPLDPKAKGRPRFGNGHAYTPKATREYEKAVKLCSSPFRPKEPFKGPVKLELEFYMPLPKYLRKKPSHSEPFIGRPDLDNLVKAIKDSFNGIFWEDDNQVVKLRALKTYSWVKHDGFTQVKIEEIENGF